MSATMLMVKPCDDRQTLYSFNFKADIKKQKFYFYFKVIVHYMAHLRPLCNYRVFFDSANYRLVSALYNSNAYLE